MRKALIAEWSYEKYRNSEKKRLSAFVKAMQKYRLYKK